MTGLEALADAQRRFADAGLPHPQGDAMPLLAHAFGKVRPGYHFYLELAQPLPPEVAVHFEAAVAARLRRQPVSQIVGARWFWKHRFCVTPDVLDPRPETEVLVAEALTAPFSRVLDLGTGSGCILLSLLAERPEARGLGADLSPAALAVAAQNAVALGADGQVAFVQADWFAGIAGLFDLIVSNPPYIAADEMPDLAPEVRDWEPRVALTPGGDGLGAYRAIAAGVGRHLSPGGRLLVEIGASQGPSVAAILRAAGLADVTVLPDRDGRDRVVRARKTPQK